MSASFRPLTGLFVLFLLGCPGTKDDSGTVIPTGDVSIVDANNYGFVGALDIPSIETASGVDVTIDWSAVTQDIQCHDLDPAEDIDNVGMVRFGQLTQAEVAEGLSTNNLDQSQMNGYVEIGNDGGTSTNIASMSFFGTVIDVPAEYVSTGGTYMVMLATGTVPGVGARMITFLAPTESSTNVIAEVPTGCGVLDFDVDLGSLAPVSMLAAGPWNLDWGGLTMDGQGNPVDLNGIDSVLLGYYEAATLDQLEAGFLDIELTATEKYTLALDGGTEADLGAAVDAEGVAFSGFHAGGEWLLALRCSRCYNPAPPFISIVSPYYEAQ